MFKDLPLELQRVILRYIRQPSHLKALCLTSKTISAIATEFLYRDLALDTVCTQSNHKDMLNLIRAISLSNGLKFVKTLKVGPLRDEMMNFFDILISRLKDHSLLSFQWDTNNPPTNSQLLYLWDHQGNIEFIDLIDIRDTIETIQPRKDKFPQKYIHICFEWPGDQFSLEKLDLSFITAMTVKMDFWGNLPRHMSDTLVQITNLDLRYIHLDYSNLELDWFPSLLRLEFYHCVGTGSILSTFQHPNLKDLRIKPDWDDIYEDVFQEDFEEQFFFIRRLPGLETLVIEAPDQRHPANLLEALTHSISSVHNRTLKYLTLLDACGLSDANSYETITTDSKNALLDAIMACTHLIQLELPSDWATKERDFEQLVHNLASVKVLCLRIHVPSDMLQRYHFEKKLPYGINIAQIGKTVIHNAAIALIGRMKDTRSDLRLLIFEIRGYEKRHCFTRGWSPTPHPSHQLAQISEDLVKYHLPEYQLMPPYAPVQTWREYCSAKQSCIEEEIRQEAIEMDEEED